DGDHHQQLDQRKAGARPVAHGSSFPPAIEGKGTRGREDNYGMTGRYPGLLTLSRKMALIDKGNAGSGSRAPGHAWDLFKCSPAVTTRTGSRVCRAGREAPSSLLMSS